MRRKKHIQKLAVVLASFVATLALAFVGGAPPALADACCPGSPYGNGGNNGILASNTTFLQDMDYHNLTVNAGVVLDLNGHVLRVCGTLLNYGTITDTSCGGTGGAGGAGGHGQDPCEGEGGPPFPEDGGPGGSGTNSPCTYGGQGGDGGGGGGGGGGVRYGIICVDANGGNAGNGGHGGRGGGYVLIYAFNLDNRGVIHTDGQAGSAGGQGTNGEYFEWGVPHKDIAGGGGGGGAGGAGGNGGRVEIYYANLLNQGTTRAAGGSGGSGGAGGLSGTYVHGHCLTSGALASRYCGGLGYPPLPATWRGGDGGCGENRINECAEDGDPGAGGPSGTPGQVINTLLPYSCCTPPSISTHPQPLTKCEGECASFSVTATGTDPLSYRWQWYDVEFYAWRNLSDNDRFSGTATPTLTICPVEVADAGQYRCHVTNSCGSANSNSAILTVNTAPTITSQPQDQTKPFDDAATFSVTASGTPALTYQWQTYGGASWTNLANDDHISGATASALTINPILCGYAGQYRCHVTNSCGSVDSNEAELTVVHPCTVNGDVSGDGVVDNFDIAPFVYALSHTEEEFEAQYPDGHYWCADTNCDCTLDNFDSAMFVKCLTGDPACQNCSY